MNGGREGGRRSKCSWVTASKGGGRDGVALGAFDQVNVEGGTDRVESTSIVRRCR